ncbi:hypothetical protein BGX31_009219 [Mortierella sp. GBA43]|nr:hypothetical protein BGX31_009219 [Mortierella sp. GBA43]
MNTPTYVVTTITMDEIVGSLLTGASMILTMHSLSRMIFMRRSGSRYNLFPIINIAQFINQICIFTLITMAFNSISLRTALWTNVIINLAYFVTKPTAMYLAYLRCSSVYPPFRKVDILHYILIGARAVELFSIIIVNTVQNSLCNGSAAKGTRCEHLAIAWTLRDAGAPIFRFYYILCEAIFYVKLFTTLKGMTQGKNTALIQYRRLQTTLFTIDLILLIAMSVYRILGIFDKALPTYVYYELFSSTLTIFNLTEFGLNIRILFNNVNEAKSNPDSAPTSPNRLEMGSIRHDDSDRGNNSGSFSPFSPSSPVVPNNIVNGGVEYQKVLCVDRSASVSKGYNSASPLTSFAAETGYTSDVANSVTTSALPSPQHQSPLECAGDSHLPYTAASITLRPPSLRSLTSSSLPVLRPVSSQSQFQNSADEGASPNSTNNNPRTSAIEERRISNSVSRPSPAHVPPERPCR